MIMPNTGYIRQGLSSGFLRGGIYEVRTSVRREQPVSSRGLDDVMPILVGCGIGFTGLAGLTGLWGSRGLRVQGLQGF